MGPHSGTEWLSDAKISLTGQSIHGREPPHSMAQVGSYEDVDQIIASQKTLEGEEN